MSGLRNLVWIAMVIGACDAPTAIEPDASLSVDGAPQPEADAASLGGCPSGTHACDDTCLANGPDDPVTGCALSCGEACPAVANGVAVCNANGGCGVRCTAGYVEFGGACVPAACETAHYVCGTVDTGGGNVVDCGACNGGNIIYACKADHTCNIPLDTNEPNNTRATATTLGPFSDGGFDTPVYYGHAHSIGDEDWFQFHVEDATNFQAEPEASIEMWLQNHTTTIEYEMTVWARCDQGDDGLVVNCFTGFLDGGTSVQDAVLGTGCTQSHGHMVRAEVFSACLTSDDSMTVVVRVRPREPVRGETYRLELAVQ